MRVRRLAVRILAGVAALSGPPLGASENTGDPAPTGLYRGSSIAVRFDVSPPLRSIPAIPIKGTARRGPEELNTGFEGPVGPQLPDSVVQSEAGTGAIPPPIATFDGPSNIANVSPPDPVGDVGPGHYVAMSNLYFAVYDKTGGLLLGPVANNTLWAGFGGPCQTENAGDPIVLYDQLADRWILTQFTSAGPTFFNCVAVSTTGDPTDTYYRYAFTTGGNFPDYPKYGIWPDALYISTREFLGTGGPFQGVGAYAINRAQILAGNPAAQSISFLVPPGATPYNVGDGLLPADLDGSALPPPGSPAYYMGSMDQGGPYGAPQDALTLWKFDVDFVTPANSTFTMQAPIPVAAFDSIFPCSPGSRNCIPQPGTATKVDILSYRQRLMHRLAYRNFGTHEALVANQSVEAAAGLAGIRWYEIRDPNGAPAIFQQGTYAPGATDGIHRWMGSIAMDAAGDIALGYSASDGVSTFPSVWYTGRLAADPAGTLPQGEGSIVHGTGSQTSSAGRWGDYSSINVDPVDDCTFWYVSQYIPLTSAVGWRLRIGSFKFPTCVAGPSGTLEGDVTICGGASPLAGATVSAGSFGTTTDAAGHYALALPPGDYTATIQRPGYTSESFPVTITDGGTTVLDTCLTGVPLLETAGATLVAESCGPNNGRIDPGETVRMNFCVRNIGAADAADLVGDLGETGGVGDAPFPAEFGAVLAGGPDVCVDVTFTADEGLVCGFDVRPALELEDGAADLGTLSYGPFPTGSLTVTASENFDGATPPALPAGWSTSGSGNLWVTTVTSPDTPPNAAFSDDPAVVSDKRLDSPAFPISTPTAQLSFRHLYDLETSTDPATGFDGGVLEIAIGASPFEDVLAAGGSFVSGGYNQTISTLWSSPIAGRPAWSGASGGYVTTVVALPASAAGQNVVFRWRMASDSSVADVGWWIDEVVVSGASTCCTPIPEGLAVDHVEDAPSNDVWEPGETVVVEPSYFNGDSAVLAALTGSASNLTGPAGATYTITDGAATYGSIAPNAPASCLDTGDCYSVSVDDPAVRPAPHWDATMLETLSAGSPKTWTLHIGDSFTDVPDAHLFYAFIETIFHNGVTGGCGGTSYCPGNAALRKQMAVFLLKARFGAAYVPPPAVGIFGDVPPADPFAAWIEDLYNRGITGGCSVSPLNYCPDNTVLRQQMAVFLLKTLEGATYSPPDCEGVFADVACPGNPFADWIEELADRQITGGCGAGNFCPASPNTRGQMAVFLTKTFRLLLYGP